MSLMTRYCVLRHFYTPKNTYFSLKNIKKSSFFEENLKPSPKVPQNSQILMPKDNTFPPPPKKPQKPVQKWPQNHKKLKKTRIMSINVSKMRPNQPQNHQIQVQNSPKKGQNRSKTAPKRVKTGPKQPEKG
jgi:hypothetical protein